MDPNKQAFQRKNYFFAKGQIPYRQRPKVEQEKAPVPESRYDSIANTLDYYIFLKNRNFMEDGVPDPFFTLLENSQANNYPSYTMKGYPDLGICDKNQGMYRYYADKRTLTCLTWAPNGKRILVGSVSMGTTKGEISLIDGATYSPDTFIQPIQTKGVKTMCMTKNNKFLLVGDEEGGIRYLDANYKPTKLEEVKSDKNNDPMKEISIAPTDAKFVTASSDNDLRIWDFEKGVIEQKLSGHKNEIYCVKWHPFQGLIASGSKDATIYFWDPRTRERLTNLMNHKQSVNALQWNANGNWLLSGYIFSKYIIQSSKDQSILMYDIRTLKEAQAFTGFTSDIEDISWNTSHERLFAAGTKDGTISFWLAFEKEPLSIIPMAHFTEKKDFNEPIKQPGPMKREGPKGVKITGLAWNPTGDQLASCGLDLSVKFWGRPKPEILQPSEAIIQFQNANEMQPEEQIS